MLTFIREDTAAITGVYASDRSRSAVMPLQETGRIVEVPVYGSTRLWLRVTMLNHSSCLFNGNFQYKQMEGSYICFREESSFERGQWAVRRSY